MNIRVRRRKDLRRQALRLVMAAEEAPPTPAGPAMAASRRLPRPTGAAALTVDDLGAEDHACLADRDARLAAREEPGFECRFATERAALGIIGTIAGDARGNALV